MSKNKADSELSEDEKSQTAQDPPPTALGWAARGVSVGLVLALLGYLLFTGLGATETALLEARAETEKIQQLNGQWMVPAVIENVGDLSVEAATVTLSLVAEDGEVIESEDVTIALLGQDGSVDVQYWFNSDPGDYELEFDTGGLVVP